MLFLLYMNHIYMYNMCVVSIKILAFGLLPIRSSQRLSPAPCAISLFISSPFYM